MKSLAFALICSLIISLPTVAQEKRKSPPKTVENTIGDLTVSINYSSPAVKGRTIFGDLEPWGNIWRAGANEATTIEFSEDVTINGEELAAGKYAFFIIPNESSDWTLIFNTEAKQWGAYKLDESKDALRIDVKHEEVDNVENLEYKISDDGMVSMEWATSRVGFKIN